MEILAKGYVDERW